MSCAEIWIEYAVKHFGVCILMLIWGMTSALKEEKHTLYKIYCLIQF